MTPEQRRRIAMTAKMDGSRVIAESLGATVSLSEMEVLTLANFARIGLLTVFAGLDGEVGQAAEAERDQLIEVIRLEFGSQGMSDGLATLSHACAAILDGEKVGSFIPDV